MYHQLLFAPIPYLVVWKKKHIFAEMMDVVMKKQDQKNFFVKMVEDKKAIIKGIREGVSTQVIEKERDVKFVTPV